MWKRLKNVVVWLVPAIALGLYSGRVISEQWAHIYTLNWIGAIGITAVTLIFALLILKGTSLSESWPLPGSVPGSLDCGWFADGRLSGTGGQPQMESSRQNSEIGQMAASDPFRAYHSWFSGFVRIHGRTGAAAGRQR